MPPATIAQNKQSPNIVSAYGWPVEKYQPPTYLVVRSYISSRQSHCFIFVLPAKTNFLESLEIKNLLYNRYTFSSFEKYEFALFILRILIENILC